MRFKCLKATAFLLVVIHASLSYASGDFSSCPQFFANGRSPVVVPHPTDRALCCDAFAILHSGGSKTPVFVAERLNRAYVADTGEIRTDQVFADSRLRSEERAELEDYKGSGHSQIWRRLHCSFACRAEGTSNLGNNKMVMVYKAV